MYSWQMHLTLANYTEKGLTPLAIWLYKQKRTCVALPPCSLVYTLRIYMTDESSFSLG
jgi:hypothetical protein